MFTHDLKVVSLVLATFFMVSCAGLEKVTNSSKTETVNEAISSEEIYSSAEQISPESAADFYNEAFAAFDLARSQAPNERTGYYQSMLDYLYTADTLAVRTNDARIQENVLKLQLYAWEKEHNQALEILKPTQTLTPGPTELDLAKEHAGNAIFLMPDSLKSYELLAQIHYMDNTPIEAQKVLELAINNLALSTDDALRIESKLSYLQQLNSGIPLQDIEIEELPVPYKVINALLDEGNWFEAINVIQAERSKKPEQRQLLLSLALVHYKVAELRMQPVISRVENSRTGNIRLQSSEKGQLNEADSHYQQAESLINELQLSAGNFESFEEYSALFFHNGALLFHQLRGTNWLPDYSYDLRVTNYANKAIQSYQRMLEEEGADKSLWSRIATLYHISGNTREAKTAQSKAGSR